MSAILYIDTSAEITTVACTIDGVVSSCIINEEQKEQAAIINILIEKALKDAAITLQALNAIALCSGPGSYTGLRIGFSTAKGLCYAADIPLITTDKFALIDRQYTTENGNTIIILQARVGEYFVAAYDAKGNNILQPCLLLTEDLHAKITSLNAHVLSNDETLCYQFSAENITTNFIGNFRPDITVWETIVRKNISEKTFADLAYSEPLYIKQAFTTVSKKKLI